MICLAYARNFTLLHRVIDSSLILNCRLVAFARRTAPSFFRTRMCNACLAC